MLLAISKFTPHQGVSTRLHRTHSRHCSRAWLPSPLLAPLWRRAHHQPPQAPTLPRAPASKARKARRWAPRALAVGAPRRRPRAPCALTATKPGNPGNSKNAGYARLFLWVRAREQCKHAVNKRLRGPTVHFAPSETVPALLSTPHSWPLRRRRSPAPALTSRAPRCPWWPWCSRPPTPRSSPPTWPSACLAPRAFLTPPPC